LSTKFLEINTLGNIYFWSALFQNRALVFVFRILLNKFKTCTACDNAKNSDLNRFEESVDFNQRTPKMFSHWLIGVPDI
jgi:hypothetical protein